MIEIVGCSGRDLRALTNELPDLAWIEAGTLTMRIARFDIDEPVQSMTAIRSSAAAAKNLPLTQRFDEPAPRLIGAPLRLGRSRPIWSAIAY